MATLHSDLITSVAIEGRLYAAGADGSFDVPDALAPRLMADFGMLPCVPNGASGGAAGAETEAVNYATWTTAEIVAEARRLGVEIPEGTARRRLIAMLNERATQ
jgi:hypothetical protein